MRSLLTGLLLVVSVTFQFAQHPLVGSWQMVSIKGVGAQGERFSIDSATAREVKVITPSHYFLIAYNVEGDSLIFNRTYFGEVEVQGTAYIERPMYSSLPIFDNVKSDFKWNISGDAFIQSGTFTRPDGKTIVLDQLVFHPLLYVHSYPQNPAIGTWKLRSSTIRDASGKQESVDDKSVAAFYIVTPSNWMTFYQRNGKFETASLGTYTLNGQEVTRTTIHTSTSGQPPNQLSLETVDGDKLVVTTKIMSGGNNRERQEIFERLK